MKTAGMVLGIIGGALALVTGVFLLALSGPLGSGDLFFYYDIDITGIAREAFFEFMRTMYVVLGICGIAAGAVGLTGGLLVRRKSVAAGVLLIIAAVLSFSILFVLAAIFSFMKEKTPANQTYAAYPPYPPQPYAPYPPQPYSYSAYSPYPPQPPQQNAPAAPGSTPTDGTPQG